MKELNINKEGIYKFMKEHKENFKYKVVYVKFSKYSKTYAYLIKDEVDIGSKVYINGKDKPLEVLNVELLSESELPVPLKDMKYASIKEPIQESVNKILDKNKVLKRIEYDNEIVGREDIINDLMVSINKKRMRNSILIGAAGSGKTTIVKALSNTIKDKYVMLAFNVGELISGTMYRGMLEEKLVNIFNDVLDFNKKHEIKIILFIDEFHMIISNAGCDGSVSMHDIIKTYLTDSNMIVIGATTVNEYKTYIKQDNALMRRLTPIYVSNLSSNDVIKILDNFSDHKLDKTLLSTILNETNNIPNTNNPDISLEVLDRVLSRNKILGTEINLVNIKYEINRIKESYMAI